MVVDVAIELDGQHPRLECIRSVETGFESCVLRGPVTDGVWPAHVHRIEAKDTSTMHHQGTLRQ